MKISKIVYALSAVTMMFGVMQSVVATQPNTVSDMTAWDMSPIASPLTQQQVSFLNLYMAHPHAVEMEKLKREVKESLPLYIAVNQQVLDPAAVIQFKRSQLLDVGMSFNDILTLQNTMNNLQEGVILTKEQNDFLRKFILVSMQKNRSISLDDFLRPLYGYVKNNPEEFSAKTAKALTESLLGSVGMKSSEISDLESLAKQKEESTTLKNTDIKCLKHFMLAARLQGVDFMEPSAVLKLQWIIHKNSDKFSVQEMQTLHMVVHNSPSVQKYNHFKANEAREVESQRFQQQQQVRQQQQQQFGQGGYSPEAVQRARQNY